MEKVYFSTKSKPTADLTTPAKNGKHIRDTNTEIKFREPDQPTDIKSNFSCIIDIWSGAILCYKKLQELKDHQAGKDLTEESLLPKQTNYHKEKVIMKIYHSVLSKKRK